MMESLGRVLEQSRTVDDVLEVICQAELHLDGERSPLNGVEISKSEVLPVWLTEWVCLLDEFVEDEMLNGATTVGELKILGSCKVIHRLLAQVQAVPCLDYLVVLLPRIAALLRNTSTTERDITLSTCICVMRSVVARTHSAALPFALSLLQLYEDKAVAADILVDASCAIASFCCLCNTDELHDALRSKSEMVVSVLETALASTQYQDEDILEALFQIASVRELRDSCVKRRWLSSLTSKRLSSKSDGARHKSLVLVRTLMVREKPVSSASTFSRVAGINVNLLVVSVSKAAVVEKDALLQRDMVSLIREVVDQGICKEGLKETVLAALLEIAVNGVYIEASEDAALAYLKQASIEHVLGELILSGVVKLATFPKNTVRCIALNILKDNTFWDSDRANWKLLASTCILDSFCVLISIGSVDDCARVLGIIKQLVFEGQNRALLLGHAGILQALVVLVTAEPVKTSNLSYHDAVNSLLVLMEDGYRSFVPFASHLLPWLVRTANATSNADLKTRLVLALTGFVNHLLTLNPGEEPALEPSPWSLWALVRYSRALSP